MDIDGNIPFGFPWAKWLDDQVAACDLMLVLIGRTWVAEFQARADPEERDFVRVEIESALARSIPVVPVILGEAPVPKSADLPPSVRPLLALQAARLQRLSFDSDAETLVTGVVRSIALARGKPVPRPAVQRPALPPKPEDRFRAEGRIRVDAPLIHGAPKGPDGAGWLLPGDGRREWFRDHPEGPEMVVIPAGHFMMGSPDDDPGRIGKGHERAETFGAEEPRHRSNRTTATATWASVWRGRYSLDLYPFTSCARTSSRAAEPRIVARHQARARRDTTQANVIIKRGRTAAPSGSGGSRR